jgi:histidyl-tRNA synthetase
LCPECDRQFEILKNALEKLNISYVIDKRLVRGLDYYTRATFEIKTGRLGAQDAVAGGGRYDGLVKALGGPDLPATGFAIGFDRLAELTALNAFYGARQPDIFIAALGETSRALAFEWTCALGLAGIQIEMDMSAKSLKSQMKRADRLLARHVLIAGETELEQGAVILRNMATKAQVTIPIEGLVENLKKQVERS